MKAIYTTRTITRHQIIRSVIRDSGERLEPVAIAECHTAEAAEQMREMLTAGERANA